MTAGLRVLLFRAIYAVALGGAVAWMVLVLEAAAAAGTLGYDYRAYDLAVDRLVAGRPLYDSTVDVIGGFGLFLYPPPFALLVATAAAVALMPVSGRVQLAVLLLAALSWPVLYAIKLGQVGPLLLLLFAVGWRWMDRPWPLGVSAAFGAAIKLQPALVLGWAVLTGRLRAAVIGLVCFALLAVVATLVAGSNAWFEELDLLARTNQPILTPHAYGVGRLLFEAGVPESMAAIANVANLAAVAAVTLFAILRASAVASYLAVAVASQFISPVLWDHYAVILLLPTAWLLNRGQRWAALIPLATSNLLISVTPPATYPIAFWVALLAVTWEGVRDRRGDRAGMRLRAQGKREIDVSSLA